MDDFINFLEYDEEKIIIDKHLNLMFKFLNLFNDINYKLLIKYIYFILKIFFFTDNEIFQITHVSFKNIFINKLKQIEILFINDINYDIEKIINTLELNNFNIIINIIIRYKTILKKKIDNLIKINNFITYKNIYYNEKI